MKLNNSHSPQRGAFLLIMVLVLGFAASLALTAYLTLLTHATRNLTGQLHTEQAHYASYAAFSASLARYRQQPQWLTSLPDDYDQTQNFSLNQIPILRHLTRHQNTITLDLTSTATQTQRRLLAQLQLGQSNTNPADIVMLIDRSGSMDDDGPAPQPYPCPVQNETEDPMISAICAAQDFVDVISNSSQIQLSVVQFATQAETVPGFPHLAKHQKFDQIKQAIFHIQVANCHNNNCYTNTGGALNLAVSLLGEIDYASSDPQIQRYIILFTDGLPTVDIQGNFCNQDTNNPPCDQAEQYAIDQAKSAKNDYQTVIYTIGLGTAANQQLLKDLASTPDHFLFTPDKQQLSDLFTQVALQIQSLTSVSLEELPPGDTSAP